MAAFFLPWLPVLPLNLPTPQVQAAAGDRATGQQGDKDGNKDGNKDDRTRDAIDGSGAPVQDLSPLTPEMQLRDSIRLTLYEVR